MESSKTESRKKLSDKEKAEIEKAILSLGNVIAEEDITLNFQKQITALAEQQQAGDLLTAFAAPYQLDIEVENIGMATVPGFPRLGRFWLAVKARLIHNKQAVKPIEQRICYGSEYSYSLVSWAYNNGQKLKEDIVLGYRYISNQVLSEILGLASDPDVVSAWNKTALACLESGNRKKP